MFERAWIAITIGMGGCLWLGCRDWKAELKKECPTWGWVIQVAFEIGGVFVLYFGMDLLKAWVRK